MEPTNDNKNLGLRVAGALLGIVAAAHLARLLAGSSVTIAGHAVPLWASAVALVAAGGLAAWLFSLSRPS